MAPPPKLAATLPSPGTLKWHLQWHQQSHHVHSLKVGRHPSSTLQWHPAMAPPPPPTTAHYNGTLQWHPAMAPRPLPQSWSSPSPSTIVRYNGTLQWHPAMAPRPLHPAMAPWCHVQSAKVVRRPHPLLEVRTPIAIAIWGKKTVASPLRRDLPEAGAWNNQFSGRWTTPLKRCLQGHSYEVLYHESYNF